MKTSNAFFLMLSFFIISGTVAAQFSIGPMLVYGSDTDLGFGIKAEFPLSDKVSVSPSYGFLSSTKIEFFGESFKTSASELNADAHYSLSDNGNIVWYGLAGLNIAFAKVTAGGESESASEVGLNVGAGAKFSVTDTLQGFAQAKYVLSEADQLGIHLGVYYSFGGN